MHTSPIERRAPLSAGLAAGAVAAVIASLASLALTSPDDVLLNSATVGLGNLVLGLLAGALLKLLGRGRVFAGAWVAIGAAACAAAIVGDSAFDGFAGYALPLTVVAFGVAGSLTFALSTVLVARWWVPLAGVVVAIVVSLSLAGRRGPSNAALALPPVSTPTADVTAEPTRAPQLAVAAVPTPPPAAATPAPTLAVVATKRPVRAPGTYAGIDFVVGQGSKATFTVGERLARMPLPNDAVISTSALTGDVHLDGRPSKIMLDLQRLSSDQPQRDRYIRTNMFPNDRVATFTVDDAPPLVDGKPPAGALNGKVSGSLALRGGAFPLTFDWDGRDDGDVFYVMAHTKFSWKDVGLEPPSSTAIVSTDDEVDVQVVLAVRPRP